MLALVFALLLGGCGQLGPLYEPGDTAPRENTPAPPDQTTDLAG